MSDLAVKVEARTPALDALVKLLSPSRIAELTSAMTASVFALVQSRFARYALSHHETADRLGAAHTGHLEEAARTMESSSDMGGGTVSIKAPGINRALGPVHVAPRGARALTIPISAPAYGRRVGEMQARGWEIFRPKGHNVLMGRKGKDAPRALYALSGGVTLPASPEMLPGHAEIAEAGIAGVRNYVRNALAGGLQ